jgi:hypothetical protein
MEQGRDIQEVRRRGFKLNETFRILGISESQGRQYVAEKKIRVVRLGPRLPIVTDVEIDRILREGIE